MKIVIDVEESSNYGLAPYSVYRALCTEHVQIAERRYQKHFWSMHTACDSTARELFAHITGRKPNVKNLILTYADAEKCFELFKSFTDVWMYKIVNQ